MRTVVRSAALAAALLVPGVSSAQVYRHETPPPAVTAANATWQLAGEPIFHAGNFYYPAGATVFFDGKVMVRTGVYEGVPLYADVTLEPFSIVYVPVGGALLQPYERRREGEIAGTVGSRTPSFPIERDAEVSSGWGALSSTYPYAPVTGLSSRMRGRVEAAAPEPAPVSIASVVEETFAPVGAVMLSPQNRPSSTSPQAFANANLPSTAPTGSLWIAFQSARWFSAGRAVPFDATRFEQVGTYQDFPVYRERGGSPDRIYVTVVRNGPIAPFDRR